MSRRRQRYPILSTRGWGWEQGSVRFTGPNQHGLMRTRRGNSRSEKIHVVSRELRRDPWPAVLARAAAGVARGTARQGLAGDWEFWVEGFPRRCGGWRVTVRATVRHAVDTAAKDSSPRRGSWLVTGLVEDPEEVRSLFCRAGMTIFGDLTGRRHRWEQEALADLAGL